MDSKSYAFSLGDAVSALKKGRFIVLHDGAGRENEADLVCLAEKATPSMIRQMRKDAGGLICVAIDERTAKRLCLEFASEILKNAKSKLIAKMGQGRMKYGDMPAFSISINHKSTFTGITDADRALTIREFGKLVRRKAGVREFAKDFRAVGHVFVLISRGLGARRGHTELSVALALKSGLTPALVLCEMLSDTGRAASVRQAKAYAKKHNIPFIEGRQIMEALADGK